MPSPFEDRRDLRLPVVVGVGRDQPLLLSCAAELAWTFDVPLRVVHAGPGPTMADLSRTGDGQVLAASTGVRTLDLARRHLESAGFSRVDYAAIKSARASGLEAESAGATVLVVGSRPSRRLAALSGGTTQHIIRHARCPVVVVPDGSGSAAREVVAAVDIDDPNHGVLPFAIDIAARWHAPLRIISVLPPRLEGPGRERQHARLDALLNRWRTVGIHVVTEVISADARDALVQITAAARMLVVGRPGHLVTRFGPARSVVGPLIEAASCPVAVVPPAPAP